MNMLGKLAVASAMVTTLLTTTSAQAECAKSREYQALSMRALQSELMVAAIACKQKAAYNSYVERFSPVLKTQGAQLQNYFARAYPQKATFQMNQFVTQMANQASRVSLDTEYHAYCKQSEELFAAVNQAMPWQVLSYAERKYSAWHEVPSCEVQSLAKN
jgi:hypothetical protein